MSQRKKLTKEKMHEIMRKLSKERPVFHSEADFQYALAWKIHEECPDYNVRLEKREVVDKREIYFDLFIFKDDEVIPIELKYKTRKLNIEIPLNNRIKIKEKYKLKDQVAHDISRYDFMKDISRIEKSNKSGFAIFLTNDKLYWETSAYSGYDDAFKIYEDRKILKGEKLSWSEKAALRTTKGHKSPIEFKNNYVFNWEDYSDLTNYAISDNPNTTFRYLLVEIPNVAPNKADTGYSVILFPDWQIPKAIVLVWPEQTHRKYLVDFYARLSAYIPKNNRLIYIIKNKGIEKEVIDLVRKYNQKVNVNCIVVPEVADIWIRDWAPIPAVDDSEKVVLVKAVYWPRYLIGSKVFREKAKRDDTAGRRLTEHLEIPIIDLPLIWDIGNLTHNGKGTAIVTERLIDDNKDRFTEKEIRTILKDKLNITNLIILPEEPGDDTGHIDGMVRFVDENTVAVGSYPENYPEGKGFMNGIAVKLEKELGKEYRIIRIPNGIPPNEKSEGIASAVGNHMNFLRLENIILLPYYGIPEDEKAKEVLQEALPDVQVIPVNTPGIKKLASKGGVLNCITWCYF